MPYSPYLLLSGLLHVLVSIHVLSTGKVNQTGEGRATSTYYSSLLFSLQLLCRGTTHFAHVPSLLYLQLAALDAARAACHLDLYDSQDCCRFPAEGSGKLTNRERKEVKRERQNEGMEIYRRYFREEEKDCVLI